MNEKLREAVLEIIAESVTLDVVTTSEYAGGLNCNDLYKDCHKIQLLLEGRVISEVYLS